MNQKKIIYSAVGAIAFVVGGILTRSRAIEGLEKLEDTFFKKDEEPAEEIPAE